MFCWLSVVFPPATSSIEPDTRLGDSVPRHSLYARIAAVIDRLVPEATAAPRPVGLLVALSGGPDSVALLLLAKAWAASTGARLQAFHLNHRLRGPDADADEDFCSQLCERLDIQLHLRREDPRPLAQQRGMGVEEAGRVLRYRLLTDLLDTAAGLDCAATGHHLDDQVETVVMRMFRGTGLDGLRGIAPVSGRLIRPLLEVSRQEIIAFLEAEGQPYRLDATNTAGEATRSRVRRELLPLARDIFGAGTATGLARLAELAETDLGLLDRLARQVWDELSATSSLPAQGTGAAGATWQEPRLSVAGLLNLEPALARRVIRLAVAARRGSVADLGRDHVAGLLQWLSRSRSGGTWELPGGWRVVREFDDLRILPPTQDQGHSHLPVSLGGSYRMLVTEETISRADGTGTPDNSNRNEISADLENIAPAAGWKLVCPANTLRGKLRLRRWRSGDRLELLGLGGHKKVSDLLREKKIGVSERSRVLVVEDDVGIIWVVGLARAERTRLLPMTQRMVTIAVVPKEEDHSL